MPVQGPGQANVFPNGRDLSFNQISLKSTEIGEYNKDIPMPVAQAAIKDDGLDQVIFEANGTRYIAYADGMNFEGLKQGNVPASIFEGNLPMTVQGSFEGKNTDIKILHIDNESNTYSEGAKNLLLITAASQAVPTAIQIALAPAAARAAANGTNLMAKITRWTGGLVTKAAQKTHLGVAGVSIGVGALILGAGVAGGALYYGRIRGQEYAPVKGLMVNSGSNPASTPVNPAEQK